MGCIFTKEDYEDDLQRYSPSSANEPLPLIEPIKTQRIIYEEKIKKIYYIEYNKSKDCRISKNDRRYKS